MRKPSATLTPQELAIMKIVWGFDTVTVREVYEALRKTRPIAYTTVMTMMNVLEDKGYLRRRRRAGRTPIRRRARGSRSSARSCGTSSIGCSTARRARCCCTSPRIRG